MYRPNQSRHLQRTLDVTCVLTGVAIIMLIARRPSLAIGLGLVALFLATTVLTILVRSERFQ